jgi:predicted ABC-type transport system involved in lysophospholipase L1 biosynthesis ATPase subunit
MNNGRCLKGRHEMNNFPANGKVIELKDITKTYLTGKLEFTALKSINLVIKEGEFLAIMGPSGSGKSTCMNIMGCLDRPTSGSYRLDGKEVAALSDTELARIRNKKLGFCFPDLQPAVQDGLAAQRGTAADIQRGEEQKGKGRQGA